MKSCNSFLKLSPENRVIDANYNHNHEPLTENEIQRQKLNNSMKRKAIEDSSALPSKLLRSHLRSGDITAIDKADIDCIKRNMRNARLSIRPKLPRSDIETQEAISQINIATNKGENFLFINDKVKKIIGFSTETNFKILCGCNKIYMDGTFRSCPKYFTQIFTIHGYHNYM